MEISLEFFSENLIKILEELIINNKNLIIKPKFVSITTHNNEDIIKKKLIKIIYKNISPHICLNNLDVKKIFFLINYYYLNNIKYILIIKGDNNSEKLYYSYNLNFFIKFNFKSFFNIINGIYCEYHLESFNVISDIKNNLLKYNNSKYFITQYFYNIDSIIFYSKFIKNYKNKLIPAFILNRSVNQLIKFSNKCKSNLPFWFTKKINNKISRRNFLLNFNIIINYILKLLNFKFNKFHFYTMNNLYLTNNILELILNNINV